MSLINDALKKAQRQRGDSTPPSPSAPSAAPMPGPLSAAPSRRATPASRPQLLLLGVGTLLGLALALGAVFLLRQPEPPASAMPPAPAAASATPELARTAAAEPAASLPVTASSLTPTKAEEAPLLTVSTRPSEPVPALSPVATAPAASPATPATPPRASLTMIQTIEAFRIAGVRASGADSKVLMNDRVYRIGDTVDHTLGIRISAVTANSITFVDEAGAAYTRNF